MRHTLPHWLGAPVGTEPSCWIPCDHVPARSWPLFKARDVLREVIESFRQEAVA